MSYTDVFDASQQDAGITEYWHEFDDGTFGIETVQDVTDIIEHNKRVQNTDTGRYNRFMHEVANISMVEWFKLIQTGVLDMQGQIKDQKAMRRWLNDRENLAWRAKLGKV
jgi:hypothetical protein